ncbi:hypothetical protein AB6G46_24345 [Providencia hangzhouensis]|uniref:hypothetical protein n=1 Tax=Providencia hangzhouensis TaxID=3031799 RepID=UPI0034DD9463
MCLSLDKFIHEDDPQEFMLSWSVSDKDKWVVENVGLSRTKQELHLFQSKWFDYRQLHPMDATLLFAVLQETIRANYDIWQRRFHSF